MEYIPCEDPECYDFWDQEENWSNLDRACERYEQELLDEQTYR